MSLKMHDIPFFSRGAYSAPQPPSWNGASLRSAHNRTNYSFTPPLWQNPGSALALYAEINAVVMLDSIYNIAPDIAPGLSLLLRGDIN